MPQTVQELVELLELEEVDHLRYRGQDPRTTMQRTYGGQVMGQALSAMYSTVPDGRLCHSLTGYFLRPGVPKASIDYQVSVMLDGGSFSNRRVVAEQEGRPIFVMAASFKTPEMSEALEAEPIEFTIKKGASGGGGYFPGGNITLP